MSQEKVEIGQAVLYRGECLELLPTLPANSVNAVITDPPYVFGMASVSGLHYAKGSRFGDLLNHSYFYREFLQSLRGPLTADSGIWVFFNWRGLPVLMKGVVEADMHIESLLIWDKQRIGAGGQIGLRPSYEVCALIPRGEFALPNRSLPDIWRHRWGGIKPHGHPAEKSETLITELVRETPAETILDPFMGSGTTGVACAHLGRKFIGMEIEPKYFDIACKRIEEAYGQGRQLA